MNQNFGNLVCFSYAWNNVENFDVDYAVCADKSFKLGLTFYELEDVNACFVVSSCNRTELYLDVNFNHEDQINLLQNYMCNFFGKNDFVGESMQGKVAFEHGCLAITGLESVVIGEHEIRGQFKTGIKIANHNKWLSPMLRDVYAELLKCANLVAEKTSLNRTSTSVVGVGVEFLKSVCLNIESARIGIIGAGESAKSFVKSLKKRGARNVSIYNRTAQNATSMMQNIGFETYHLYENISDLIENNDYIFASIFSEYPVIDAKKYESKRFIDISVPSIIEDTKCENVFSMVEIQNDLNSNIKTRQKSAQEAKEIIKNYCESI